MRGPWGGPLGRAHEDVIGAVRESSGVWEGGTSLGGTGEVQRLDLHLHHGETALSLSLTAALLVLSHWGEPAGPGYLALHITLWETITALILSVDLLWVNKEFVNCNRSKSWWIRLFNLAYCCNTCNVMISYTVWYKVSLCVVPPYWYKSVRFEQYWHTEQSAEIFSVILSFRPRGRSQSVTAQLPTPPLQLCRTVKAGLRYPRSCDQTTVRTIFCCFELNWTEHPPSLSLSLPLDTGPNWQQITV